MGIFTLVKGLFHGGKFRIALYILVAVSIGGYIYYLKNDNSSKQKEIKELISNLAITRSQLTDAITVNNNNKAEFKKYKLDTKHTFEAINLQHKKELKEVSITTKILERINYDKKDHDGVAAVVLINAFSGLQQLESTNQDHNKSENSQARSTR